MATLIPGVISTYSLTEPEERAGSVFSQEQIYVIQNLLANCAAEKIALTFDPTNPQLFIQQEAELQGKIGVLRYLLDRSEEMSNQLKEQF
jgi:hypothetical protein